MELTTILGIIVALIGLLVGMIMKGVSLAALATPAAILIIIVGTVGAVLNAFPMSDIKNVPKLFKIIFTSDKGAGDNVAIVIRIKELSIMARKEGLLALDAQIANAPTPFFRRGLSLLTTGINNDEIESIMMEDIEAMEKRHQTGAQIFAQAGMYAPTLGVLGAVIGLIAALANMGDTDALGHAISAAFIATVYGIFTGYVLWHPFANKLKQKSKKEVTTNTIIMVGLLSIARGESPTIVQEAMVAYLPEKEKDAVSNKK